MKTNIFFLIAAVSATTFASCSKEQQTVYTNPAHVRFTAGIEGTATRTTDGGNSWVLGDGIGIYMLSGNGAIPAGIVSGTANRRYNVADTYTGALLPDAATTPIEYPDGTGIIDFVAYYPYSTNLTANGQLAVAFTDQSDPAAIDVLTAKNTGTAANTGGAVNFTFAHALSKITLHIRAGTDINPLDVAATTDVKLLGTPGSVNVDVNGGIVTDMPNAPVPLAKAATAAVGYNATFTAIIAPSSGLGRSVVLQIPTEGSVSWAIPPDAFIPGRHYSYWGEIDANTFKVTETDITEWIDNSLTEIDDKLPARLQGNNRVTWDAENSRYTLTTDPTNAGLYFHFGSVTGLFSGNGAVQTLPATSTANFAPATDIAWNPTDATTWATIPRYDGAADYPNTITPESGYHTTANVKLGKGDPCRLVGLDLAYIKATGAGTLTTADIDNGKWRLPTIDEHMSFSGQQASTSYTAHWVTLEESNVTGGKFPDAELGGEDTFLPAAGRRVYNNGVLAVHGTAGYYWSSTPHSNTEGNRLTFGATVISPVPSTSFYIYGYSVRCVRQ